MSKSLFKCMVLAIAILFGISGTSVRAAVIWQTPTTISGDSDVSKQGTLLQAFNLGIGTSGSATVNGVTFSNVNLSGTGSTLGTGEGALKLSVLTGGWANSTFGSASTPFSGLSSGYKSLLDPGNYTSVAKTAYLTLQGLVIGQEYLVQFWINDSRNTGSAIWDRTNIFDGSVTLDFNVENKGGGVGQYLIGTFTATTTSEAILVTAGVVSATTPVQLNGFQVRAIPEPGTASLALAATGMLLLRRRRKS